MLGRGWGWGQEEEEEEGDYDSLFSSPTPKTREGSSWVPVAEELQSLGTIETTSCTKRTLGNMHIKHTGKRRGNRPGEKWVGLLPRTLNSTPIRART